MTTLAVRIFPLLAYPRVMSEIQYVVRPPVDNSALNALFSATWDGHRPTDFRELLEHALGFVCAFEQQRLVGFVKVVWDGGVHAFLLDPTVHPSFQRRGIGRELVVRAAELCRSHPTVEYLHVDFEAHLAPFYEACGFQSTHAGLMRLSRPAIGS